MNPHMTGYFNESWSKTSIFKREKFKNKIVPFYEVVYI